MAGGFDNGVSSPGAASFNAPLLNFQQFANWANDFQRGQQNQQQIATGDQQQQINSQKIQQNQQAIDQASAFPNGLPIDPKTGQVDYSKAAQILAQKGDISSALTLLQQAPPAQSPMLAGGGAPVQGQPQGGQPASVPAQPLPAPAAGKPQGDPGQGTIADIVTDRLPNQDATTGQTIGKIAEVMGVAPNAVLTPGQMRRAQGLLQKYAPDSTAPSDNGGGGALPPSANAGSPAPKVTATAAPAAGAPPQPAQQPPPAGQPVPQRPVPQAVPQQPQPQQQQAGGPITPQVPLPKGFTDPQTAILALRAEAARLGSNPKAKEQVEELKNWAERIEASIKPVEMSAGKVLLDPKTGQPITQGNQPTLSPDAIDAASERYLQTGTLPPNMGRGVQGQATMSAIQNHAAELAAQRGIDMATLPDKWQKFQTQAAGRRTLENRAAGLELAENEASSLIPRVRDISGQVSRTQFPNLNSLILAARKGSGDPNVVKLGVAVESLIPVYAKVLKPVGTVGAADMERAHDILDKAWSDGQINAALDQMQIELKSARSALDKTMDEFGAKKPKEDQSASSSSGSTAKWTTLPNGVRIREISQ